MSSLSAQSLRHAILVTVACLAIAPFGRAQDVWNGTTDNSWNTASNWSTGSPPGTTPAGNSPIAQFSNPTPGFTSITLNGAAETPTNVLFTGTIPAYTLGSTVGDGTLSMTTAGTSTTGALAIASSVTTAQTINSNIQSTAASPIFFTNSGALGSTNGTPGLTIAGTLTLPLSGTLNINQVNGALTLVSGAIGSAGTGSLTMGGTNGTAGTSGTLRLTGQNTYTGGTLYGGTGVGNIIQIGSSSNALPGPSFTTGPLGTGTITVRNNVLEPIGGNQAISNAILINGGGYTFQTAPTSNAYNADPTGQTYNLELDGPISYAATETTGRTLTASMTSTNGNILTFGNATTPSTISLSQDTAGSIGTAFKSPGTAGTVQLVVLNDVIQDVKTSGTADTVSWGGSGATLVGTFFRFNSQNTYNGGTGTALTQTSGVFQLNVNTVGSPVASGPFGQGSVIPNNATSPPILQAYGADRTLANAITMTSGFVVDNASSYTGMIGADSSGAHNLSLTGAITVPGTTNKNISNNMVAGVALYLGGSPTSTLPSSSISFTGAGGATLTFLQQLGGSPLINPPITAGNGNTVIYDTITGAGGLAVTNGATVSLNSTGNNYTGATSVSTASGTLGGTLLVNGTITASSTVLVNGIGTGSSAVGTGGTLGGTGTITPTVTIGSIAGGSQGGIVSPGPGNSVPGTLNVGSMIFNRFGQYTFLHDATNSSSSLNDLISGSGTLNLGDLSNGQFNINLVPVNFSSTPTQMTYTLATFAQGMTGAPVTGGAFPSGTTDVSSLFTFSGAFTSVPGTMYAAVVGNSGGPQSLTFTFTPVPEPAFILAACGGLTALIGWRRARRAKPVRQ